MKLCRACGKLKSEGDYYKDIRHRDGLYSWCKGCCKERANYILPPSAKLIESIAIKAKKLFEADKFLRWHELVRLLPKNDWRNRKALIEALTVLNAKEEIDEQEGFRFWSLTIIS